MKEFIHNNLWIIPVVAAVATIGLGIFIGWLMTRNTNMYEVLGTDTEPSDEPDASKMATDWINNPANPANPNSQLNPCNPTSIFWNNH